MTEAIQTLGKAEVINTSKSEVLHKIEFQVLFCAIRGNGTDPKENTVAGYGYTQATNSDLL